MSWFMWPQERLDIPWTFEAREAYHLALHDPLSPRFHQLLFSILDKQLLQLQEAFDRDNGDPQTAESERQNLGPVWPAPSRYFLRLAIFNNPHNFIDKYNAFAVGADVHIASFLTEHPGITVPLRAWRGMITNSNEEPSTRLGMITKHVWILIGVRAHESASPAKLPRDTDHPLLVYVKVSDAFPASNTNVHNDEPLIPDLLGWKLEWNPKSVWPKYIPDHTEIPNLDKVVLLGYLMAGLDRKAPDFEEKFRKGVRMQAQEFIGGPWYVAENDSGKVFQRLKTSITADDTVFYHCSQPQCPAAMDSRSKINEHLDLHSPRFVCTTPDFIRTNPDCYVPFETVVEWKWHEYNSHQQQELWLCLEHSENRIDGRPKATAHTCHKSFNSSHSFGEHLRDEHGIEDSLVKDKESKQRVGKASQGQIWCGFCEAVINLGANAGRDETFNHILDHLKDNGYNWESFCQLNGTYLNPVARLEMKLKFGHSGSTQANRGSQEQSSPDQIELPTVLLQDSGASLLPVDLEPIPQ